MSNKKLIALGVGLFFGLVFYISSRLSSDALGLGLGVFLGVMASLPITLIAIMREREARAELERYRQEPKSKEVIENRPAILLFSQKTTIDKQVNIYPDRREAEQIFSVRSNNQIEANTAGTTEEEEKPYPRVYR